MPKRKSKGKATARTTPYDPQGTKPAGESGTTKAKKSMARTYSAKSTKRTGPKKKSNR